MDTNPTYDVPVTTISPEEEVTKLRAELDSFKRSVDTYHKQSMAHRGAVERLQEYLIENYEDLELHADSIAEMFDLTLERVKTFTVTMTVEVSMTVSPDEADDAENRIYQVIDATSSSSDVEIVDYRIDSVEED